MPIIPNFNKETPRASGAVWWFAVLAGALAVAFAARFFINGGAANSNTLGMVGNGALALAGIAFMGFGLLNAFRSNLKEPDKGETVLKISDDD